MSSVKEVNVFSHYEKYNKLKVIGISLLIAVVIFTIMYFFIKSLFSYSVSYELNGGWVYSQRQRYDTVDDSELRFLQKIQEPKGIKRTGYYIEYWSKQENLNKPFRFGSRIWRSTKLYVKWAEGVAVKLNFADGEVNEDMSLDDLKGYYEQYVKPGSTYTLPLIFNTTENSEHYGEQLLWYDNEECTGDPFEIKTYENLTEDIEIYGKWFDTSSDKFKVDENGTLQRYLGRCYNLKLPNNVKKIKDIPVDQFTTGESDQLGDAAGTNLSVWQNVLGDDTGNNGLAIVYLNSELIEIGDCAFKNCKALEKIVFTADNVEIIGRNAFENCTNLSGFVFPSKVTVVESHAFAKAFSAKAKVSLHLQHVKTIADEAFKDAYMKEIVMDEVEFIGLKAFASCDKLTTFTINNTQKIVTSNVPEKTGNGQYNENGIFKGVNLIDNIILTINVPQELKASYLTLHYWQEYSHLFA